MKRDRELDASIVPKIAANKDGQNWTSAEQKEGRDAPEGNEMQQNIRQTQGWESMQIALHLVHQNAKANKKMQFTSLMHHIYNPLRLHEAYLALKPGAAAGIDGQTWDWYGEELESKLQDLSERLKSGAYRAKPVRRVYIPKADGRQRPLGVPTLEDKIVQRATVTVLNAIYEADFVDFSYGFRPQRSQHMALDVVTKTITVGKVSWVLDADISDFFGSVSHEWLVKFIEHRIGDKRVVRLIQKWLKAGVLEDGQVTQNESGTPQGGSASPLLANVYMHYVYDLWVQQWSQKTAFGEMFVVRYADDTIVGFQHRTEAQRFLNELKARLQKFGLELHPEKTRLINFGRFAVMNRKEKGKGKPDTFEFLGFTHMCWTNENGWFTVRRQTIKKRLRAKAKDIAEKLKRKRHESIKVVGSWLKRVLQGHYQYYAVPGNLYALQQFRQQVTLAWKRSLGQRSQRGTITWERMERLQKRYLPYPTILHPHPLDRI